MVLDFCPAPDAVSPAHSLPTAAGPFEAVPEALRAPLEARGFESLTAVQRAVLEAEVQGRDLQISSQTGSGKTVALGFVAEARTQAPSRGREPAPRP